MDSGSLVFNNAPSGTAGNDITFTNRLTIDGSGNVGINDTSPGTRVSGFIVRGSDTRYFSVNNINAQPTWRYDDNGVGSTLLQNLGMTGSNHGMGIQFQLGNSAANSAVAGGIYCLAEQTWSSTASTKDAYLRFDTATDGVAVERVRIDSIGRVTTPYQPAFIASKNSGQNLTSSVNNIVAFETEVIDIGSNYSSNKFTAPVSGIYQFQFTCMGSSPNAGYLRMSLKKNGSGFYGLTYATITVNAYESIVSSSLINLSANDYVEAEVFASMASVALDNTGTFSGYLVG